MKHPITDSLQVIAAILITTGMVVANAAPMPKPVEHKAEAIQKTVPAPTQTVPESTPVAETTIDPPAPETPVEAPVVAQIPVYSGSHEDWLTAAGIDQSQWSNVDYIVTRESGWNPNAVNPNGGACGLGQQLPCGKWAGAWNDPVAALVAMDGYVSRYGGWAGAVAYWQSHGNY